jgi:DNA-binding GntR family transcriptional regulator
VAKDAVDRVPRRRNLADDVADHIREAILTGRMRPGTRVDQDAIAEELGVSRLPVREALIALDQEGLIATIPRRGSRVQQLSPDDIIDHYELFGQVAGLATARAVTRIDEAGVARLSDLHAQMEATPDKAERQRLNFEFHRTINTAAGSKRINSMLRLLSKSLPMPYVDFPDEWLHDASEQHDEIMAAFTKRDSAAAQRAMQNHISSSGRHAIDVLTAMGFFEAVDADD